MYVDEYLGRLRFIHYNKGHTPAGCIYKITKSKDIQLEVLVAIPRQNLNIYQ